ncbi:hypothetical protein [Asaia spathodeae]|uniref:Uncharacterized protein n=1 Tax=Asaia spathodeae TaxID=657016 RepID=A0ABX2P896_9PROT|nr:hypothetical protein [Asaia spathodeae]GBR15780.1 hypothetical protein AA105894_1416 [Asaia spathodeae NBRC 105894]
MKSLKEFVGSGVFANIVSSFGLIAACIAAWLALDSANSGQEQAAIASKTYTATIRPWLKVTMDKTILPHLRVSREGELSTGLMVNMHNFGTAPATGVVVGSLFSFETTADISSNEILFQKAACDKLEKSISFNNNEEYSSAGAIVFPSDELKYGAGDNGVVPKGGLRTLNFSQAICVHYKMGKNVFQTSTSFYFSRDSDQISQILSSRPILLQGSQKDYDEEAKEDGSFNLVPGTIIPDNSYNYAQQMVFTSAK